jgi:hypothetical protein
MLDVPLNSPRREKGQRANHVKPRIIEGDETTPAKAGAGVENYEISAYLTRLFGIASGDLGEAVGKSWLSEARKSNRAALQQRTEEILRDRNVWAVSEISPNLATQILEFGQNESRPALIELWARLLANALDRSRNNVRLSFVETVRQMDPQDAMLMRRMVRKGYRSVHDEDAPAALDEATISLLAGELNLSQDSVIVSLEHLEDLGILANNSSGSLWRTTSFGREFLRACYRYR